MNAALRKAIVDLIGSVGVAPDLKNDEALVMKLCASLGIPRDIVADELTEMRVEAGRQMMARMGVRGHNPSETRGGLFAMLLASRDHLSGRAASYADAFRRRASQSGQDLMMDIDPSEFRMPRSRQFEQETQRVHP